MLITNAQCRMARAGLNLTVTQLADAAGVSVNTITRLENGGNVNIGTLAKIQAALSTRGAHFQADGSVSLAEANHPQFK